METPQVETIHHGQISEADVRLLLELRGVVYPPEVLAGIRRPPETECLAVDWPAERRSRDFVIRQGGRIVSASCFLPRRVRTAVGDIDVAGLAGVMTHPDCRKLGLGRLVVRAALACVDEGTFAASVFQTAVPEFYRKLGARVLPKEQFRFVNSYAADPQAWPWWNDYVMVYPAAYDWPAGTTDLLGPGW